MLSYVWSWFRSAEHEKEMKVEQMERENKFLDFQLMEENRRRQQGNDSTDLEPFPSPEVNDVTQGFNSMNLNQNKEDTCSSQKGVITSLNGNNGAIDTYIYFDCKAADGIFHDLAIGCVVEYLTFQKSPNDVPRVVKVQRIVEDSWEEKSESKIQETVAKLGTEKPTIFKTEQRNVMGIIITRQPSSIWVETENGRMEIELDNVEITFLPNDGDRVILLCDVQLDNEFVDKQGEIVQVIKVMPQRIEPNKKCVVERVYENLSLLGSHTYILKADIPAGVHLHLGDMVRADLIECQYAKFTKRAIKLSLMEKNFGAVKFKPSFNSGTINECQTVSIIGVTRHISTELLKKHQISLQVRNNSSRILQLKSVKVTNVGESQLGVLEPLEPVDIAINGEITLILEVKTKFMGESSEKFELDFGNFKMRRNFVVIVCETKEKALNSEKLMAAADTLIAPGESALQRSRFYANQVWSTQREVVPGQAIAPKRRFVKLRLLNYEVPEKLRQIYLTTDRRLGVFDAIESQYPVLKEDLNPNNYSQIMSLFLHLEEIEYFVMMRNFDRDRAYFHRDGEYLSLLIENLAERRPSLVVGDVVRAINPWVDSNNKESNKVFEGIIHKVLCNRVLLKFNTSFQEKYNGEDYRLEFYFSRFSFRKQHYSISNILNTMGEEFLFPTKLTKRQRPQLEVRMDDDDDSMYMYDSKLKWFSPSLNRIQKRAVFNILRGEALYLPYVIFGPPGTGKTMTLVETILQLVVNIPGARLLVGTPSNSSADLITKRIIESNALKPGEFVRLVSFNQIEKDMIPPEIMKFCATVDIGTSGSCEDRMIVTESGLKMRCQMQFIGSHRVTISTTSTLGNFLQMNFPSGHFTHVLIDEAGQCTEPETMVPIIMLVKGQSQVVLAGDPRQLHAIVINRYSCSKELATSFLERLLDRLPYKKDLKRFPNSSGYNPMVLTKLLNNYRSLPSIMSTYSNFFYEGELIATVSDKDSREIRLLESVRSVFRTDYNIPKKQGAFFFAVDGKNMQDYDSPSWYNPQEAKEVYLMTISLYRLKVHEDQIGILTPYAKQVKTIRAMFTGSNVAMPKIGSVEEFQGQERDIMLISTVRSSQALVGTDAQMALGFVKSKKRLNVAISRARAMMVIFGNPHLLGVDDSWRQYISYCANNKALFGCELPDFIVNGEVEKTQKLDTFDCSH